MTSRRHAILMGTSTYEDSRLRNLACPERDVRGLQEILQSPDTGRFDSVSSLINQPHYELARAIHETLNRAGSDDLVLLFYSGHGKLNHFERLFLAATNTESDTLESTALPVHTIRELIDVSSCRRVVLLLDCCYSGAAGDVFVKGGVDDQLQKAGSHGRGTYILTASTAIEAAQEKEGEEYSVFTKHVIQGLRTGEADRNHDGLVTVDELYDYVRNRVVEDAAGQEPSKWGIDVRSDVVIAKSGRTPRKRLARAVRARLLELMQEDLIPDEIYTTTRAIFAKPAHVLTPSEQAYERLLAQLRDRELRPGRFLMEWGRASKTAGSSPPAPPEPAEPQESVEASRKREETVAAQGGSPQSTEPERVEIEPEELTATSAPSMPYWLEEAKAPTLLPSAWRWLVDYLVNGQAILVVACVFLGLYGLFVSQTLLLPYIPWLMELAFELYPFLPIAGFVASVILAWVGYHTESWRMVKQAGWGALLVAPFFFFLPIWLRESGLDVSVFLLAISIVGATGFFIKYAWRTPRGIRAGSQRSKSDANA